MPREKPPVVESEKNPPDEQMQVTLRGSAEKVMQRLGDKRDDGNGKPPESDDAELAKALSDPQNAVVVRRIAPRLGPNGEHLNVEVWSEACPLTMHDIMEEVQANHGGRKYRIAVVNMETRKTIAARRIEVDADPIIPGPDPDEEKARQALIEGMNPQPTPDEITAEALDREAQLLAKQAAVERQKQTLEEIRSRKQAPPPVPTGKDPEIAALKAQLEAMEKRNIELAYQTKLDAMQRELDALKNRAPASDPMQKLLLDYMKTSDERFNKLIETMQATKLDQISRELAALKNAPSQQGNEVVSKIVERALDNLLGGDEEDDDEDEDKPFLERLADKYLPEVFDILRDKEKKDGRPVSREEVIAHVNAAADRAVAEERARLAALAQQRQPQTPALPVPPPQPTQPAAAANQPPAPAPSADTKPPERLPTLEEEVKLRAAQVMTILDREMALRTREFEWSYLAWQSLPEDLLGKLAAAPGPVEFLEVMKPLVNPEGIETLKGKVVADAKLATWFARGIADIKTWHDKLQKDPNFDPDDEEDGA